MTPDLNIIFSKLDKAKNISDYRALIKELDKIIENEPDNTVLLEKRAKFHEKFQQYGDAINDYKKILKIDSENKYAKTQTELLQTILRYSNTDIYASPNTNMDPWLE